MISTAATNNVTDLVSREPIEVEVTEGPSVFAEDLQLWSALTLGSLQKQLTGHEDDPRFSEARRLVDGIAEQFATADPIDIADYFEAIQALAALKSDSKLRLNELDELDHLAA